jgi:hypothetical protein
MTKGAPMIKKYSLWPVVLVVALVLLYQSCFAQVYKWRDENGSVHFSSDINPVPERHWANTEATESEGLPYDQTAYSHPGLRTYRGNLEPVGFGDIEWGAELPFLDTLEYVGGGPGYGGIEIYIRNDDDFTIGTAALKRVEYRFWRNKFCGARSITEGYSNFAILKEAAFELFGDGYRPNPSIERYFWIGDRTNITLDYDELTGWGGLLMNSVLMIREMEEAGQQKGIEEAKKQ